MSSFTRTDTDPNVSSLGAFHSLYTRQQAIGSGGIGTVYHGLQTRLNRDVAIKEIKDIFHVFADVQREDIVERFVKIVQAQAKLNHTNIIETLDVISDAEYPFVVTQWAPNGNLRRLIDGEGRPPLNVAMRYFLQILHALTAAHDAKLVHGGLKPENVVLDQAGNALLTDFGLSRVVERSGGNQVYVGVGTVAYMSPEQFHNPNISVKSDIYSLGIMFYEMLTGKVPGRRSPMPSSFYPDIPRKLDDIFDRMSMDSAEDRYDSTNEILMEIYASPEVMKILDKRGGVLFLRDPMSHGASGLGKDVTFKEEPASASALDDDAYSYEPLDSTPSSLLDESPSLSDEDSAPQVAALEQASEAAAADDDDADSEQAAAADEVADEDLPQSDVLDKLDKYGAMFDDDDDLDG